MKTHGGRLVLGLVISLMILGEGQGFSQEVKVPQKVQFPFLLKILTYDKALKGKAQDTLGLGLLYNPESGSSIEDKDKILEAFEEFRDKKVRGLSIQIYPLGHSGLESFSDSLTEKGIQVLIITTGNDEILEKLISTTRERKILTFSTSPELVEKGVSVGIDLVEDKMKIVINYEATKMEGSDFRARLLKICRLVRE